MSYVDLMHTFWHDLGSGPFGVFLKYVCTHCVEAWLIRVPMYGVVSLPSSLAVAWSGL